MPTGTSSSFGTRGSQPEKIGSCLPSLFLCLSGGHWHLLHLNGLSVSLCVKGSSQGLMQVSASLESQGGVCVISRDLGTQWHSVGGKNTHTSGSIANLGTVLAGT